MSGIVVPKSGDRVRLLAPIPTLDDADNTITLLPGSVCSVVQVGPIHGKGLGFTLISVDHGGSWPFFVTEKDLVDGAYPFEMA